MPLGLIILGKPASGKSTLAQTLVREYSGVGHFAVRMYFLRQIKEGTELGQRAQPFSHWQQWLPDELVIQAVRHEMEAGAFKKGFVFEGMPGNKRQAVLLDILLQQMSFALTAVLYLDTPEEICMQRARTRRVCVFCDGGVNQAEGNPQSPDLCAVCSNSLSMRPSDSEDAFRKRLSTHQDLAQDLLEYYSPATAIRIDASLSPSLVLAETQRRLGPLLGSAQ